jgi:hypothetical protein
MGNFRTLTAAVKTPNVLERLAHDLRRKTPDAINLRICFS